MSTLQPIQCAGCKDTFQPKRSRDKYCHAECRHSICKAGRISLMCGARKLRDEHFKSKKHLAEIMRGYELEFKEYRYPFEMSIIFN